MKVKEYDYNAKKVGNRIKELRGKKEWSQNEFAEKLGYTRQNISHIERGEVKNISVDFLVKCSELFKVSIDYIIYGENFIETDSEKAYIKIPIKTLERISKEINAILEQLNRE